MGTSADEQLRLASGNATQTTENGVENYPNILMILIIIVGFILLRLCGRIPKRKTPKGILREKGLCGKTNLAPMFKN